MGGKIFGGKKKKSELCLPEWPVGRSGYYGVGFVSGENSNVKRFPRFL